MEEIKKKISELNEKIDTLQQHILDIEDMLVDVFGISEFISRTLTTNKYNRKFNKIVDKKAETIEKPIVLLPKPPIMIKYQSENTFEIKKLDYELYLNDKYKWVLTLKLKGQALRGIEDFSFYLKYNVYGYENNGEKLAFTKDDNLSLCFYKDELEKREEISKSGSICICEPREKVRIGIVNDINPKTTAKVETIENKSSENLSRIRLRNMAQEWNNK